MSSTMMWYWARLAASASLAFARISSRAPRIGSTLYSGTTVLMKSLKAGSMTFEAKSVPTRWYRSFANWPSTW